MSRYNLVDEEWIPVIDLDGNRKERSIHDTLMNAELYAGIEDPSPLVTAALYRFSLAILYRALKGPCDITAAKKLFNEGLPKEIIEEYLVKWKSRFWLFDEKYPFGQIPEFKPSKWRTWTAITSEHNADNAKVLFDHIDLKKSGEIDYKAAVCWLLAIQTFSLSAGKSEISHTGTAPSAGSLLAIPIGKNLHDTFIFCLIPQNNELFKIDLASWEREPESLEYLSKPIKKQDEKTGKEKNRTVERTPNGIVDLFTWRSRSIVFKMEEKNKVSEVGLASGVGFVRNNIKDPMVGNKKIIKKNKKSGVEEISLLELRFEEKGVWRDFDSLLPDDSHLAPPVIEHAVLLTLNNQNRRPKGVLVLGQRNNPPRPNLLFWRNEFFILPYPIRNNRNIRTDIYNYLQIAKNVNSQLFKACSSYARDVLSVGDRIVENSTVNKFVEQMPLQAFYWSRLESIFHIVLKDYATDKDPDDIYFDWMVAVRDTFSGAWKLLEQSIDGSNVVETRALVNVNRIIGKQLKELNEDIKKLQPQKALQTAEEAI